MFIVFSFSLLFYFSLVAKAHARDRTIIVDESNPPKARIIRPLSNTRVICIKNSPAVSDIRATEDDVCPELGGYYCKSVGKQAWLRVDYQTALDEDGPTTSVRLGRVMGVSWRDRGQPVGMYLEARPDFPGSLAQYLRSNVPSPSDTFYFIIDTGTESTLLVETHRIIIRE